MTTGHMWSIGTHFWPAGAIVVGIGGCIADSINNSSSKSELQYYDVADNKSKIDNALKYIKKCLSPAYWNDFKDRVIDRIQFDPERVRGGHQTFGEGFAAVLTNCEN